MTEDDLKKLRETQSLGCGRDCSGAADEVVDKLIAEVRRLHAWGVAAEKARAIADRAAETWKRRFLEAAEDAADVHRALRGHDEGCGERR